MKSKIILMVVLIIFLGFNGCTKKASITQTVKEIEAGSNISLADLITVDPEVESVEAQSPIETVVPGIYEVIVLVREGTESKEVKITYTVVDTSSPVISQNEIPKVAKDAVLVFSDFISIVDNSGEDLSSQLDKIKVDTSAEGDFEVTCEITDSSGNKGSLLIKYSVVIDLPPVFYESYIPTVPQGYAMKLWEFMYVVDDSGEDYKPILDKIVVDTSTIGNHEVLYKIKDSAGNESSFVFKYIVVAPNVFVPGITYKISHFNENATTTKISVTFNKLVIDDVLNNLPDIEGYKYIAMDLTIKNTGTLGFSDFMFLTTEVSEPVFIPRDITFSNGDNIKIWYQDFITVDASKTYNYEWAVGETKRVYWFVSVPDDDAKLDFEISVPIGCTKFSYFK